MAQRVVTIGSRDGLHARPAAVFSRAAAAAPVEVTIAIEGGHPVSAGSVLGVMALGAKHGHKVTLAAEGEEAEGVLDDLARLLASDGES